MIDNKLIEEFKNGDRVSFGKVMDFCLDPLLITAFRLVGRREDAEDIVQECFMTIWEKRGTIKRADSFIPWVRKIVVNRCYDFLRVKARNRINRGDPNWQIDISIESFDLADRQLDEEEVTRLLNYISRKLSPKQRLVFVLTEIEGLSHGEISSLTGMTHISIKSNAYHAREKVKSIFLKMERKRNG